MRKLGRLWWKDQPFAPSVRRVVFGGRKRDPTILNTVAGADLSRPVACITLYPYFRDFGLSDRNAQYGGAPDEYRQILRDVVDACPHTNAHLIESRDILTNIGGLTGDLIHPSDNAMIEMGQNPLGG